MNLTISCKIDFEMPNITPNSYNSCGNEKQLSSLPFFQLI